MVVVAALGSAWAASRWLLVALGLTRARRLPPSVRGEGRRAAIIRAAWAVLWSVLATYLWAVALDLQPTETFVGFIAAVTVISLGVIAAGALMQPAVRTPETLDLFRLHPGTSDTTVRPVGTVLETDAKGYLVPVEDSIEPPWDAVVSELRGAILEHWGERVHSIYVRGSVAAGTAVEGFSDVDGIVVVHGSPGDLDTSWLRGFDRSVRARHPFCEGVEAHTVAVSDVTDDDGRTFWGFLLATQAVCVHGEDLRPSLPRFRPGPLAVTHLLHLNGDIDTFLAEATKETDPDEVRAWVSWIMRRIVRAGFELVMEDEGTYTRDLYPCYEAFRRHHPDRAEDMWRALELAVEPSDATDEAATICEGLGRWLVVRGAVRYPA